MDGEQGERDTERGAGHAEKPKGGERGRESMGIERRERDTKMEVEGERMDDGGKTNDIERKYWGTNQMVALLHGRINLQF